jgi:hypothetical protein
MPKDLLNEVHKRYPYGYQKDLISFVNPKGEMITALPFETEDIYYLIKMPRVTPVNEKDYKLDDDLFLSDDDMGAVPDDMDAAANIPDEGIDDD